MTLKDEVRADSDDAERLRAKVSDLQKQLGSARKSLTDEQRAREAAEKIAAVSTRQMKPPRWITPPRRRGTENRGTLCLSLSDCHFDEIVDPAEVEGRNAYSREIAELRLEKFFGNAVKITRNYLKGVELDGCYLDLGGDLVSGTIHEEITQSNEAHAPETAFYWSERIAAGMKILADEFGRVLVTSVSGNHGRLTRKPRSKGRTRDNWDWLIAKWLEREFQADERFDFIIPDATDVLVTLYSTTFLVNHGDQVSGGGGIGGIWPPIMRMVAKKRSRHDFDVAVIHHWHSLIQAPEQGLIVNGSLKGTDEYALTVLNAAPERAQQALWITTPEHGVTFQAPILVVDRKAEGW